MRRAEKRGANMREGGFTLLELLVAIGVLTVGLLAVATMQSTAIQGNLLGYRYTEAANLAQDRMEYLLTLPYDNSLWDNGNHTDPLTTPANYDIKYVVDDYDVTGGAVSNAKKITVTVSVQDKGITRTTVLNYVRPEVF
jgi:prepilin-type N-terminal cleavage/methylation domain-containing protein